MAGCLNRRPIAQWVWLSSLVVKCWPVVVHSWDCAPVAEHYVLPSVAHSPLVGPMWIFVVCSPGVRILVAWVRLSEMFVVLLCSASLL